MRVTTEQIWEDVRTGTHWNPVRTETGSAWWTIRSTDGSKTKSVPEWLLFESYKIVREAP